MLSHTQTTKLEGYPLDMIPTDAGVMIAIDPNTPGKDVDSLSGMPRACIVVSDPASHEQWDFRLVTLQEANLEDDASSIPLEELEQLIYTNENLRKHASVEAGDDEATRE
jgi:hypothetical protein